MNLSYSSMKHCLWHIMLPYKLWIKWKNAYVLCIKWKKNKLVKVIQQVNNLGWYKNAGFLTFSLPSTSSNLSVVQQFKATKIKLEIIIIKYPCFPKIQKFEWPCPTWMLSKTNTHTHPLEAWNSQVKE